MFFTVRTNIFIQLLTLLTSVLTARLLGPLQRGELALVLLYPMLIANITIMGFEKTVAFMTGRGLVEKPLRMIRKIILLLVLPSIVSAFILIKLRISDSHLVTLALIYTIFIPLNQLFVLLVAMLNGTGNFILYNKVRLINYAMNCALIALVFFVSESSFLINIDKVQLILLSNMLASMTALIALSVSSTIRTQAVNEKNNFTDTKTLLSISSVAMMYMIPQALGYFNTIAYQIYVAHWANLEQLGTIVVMISYTRMLAPFGSAAAAHLLHEGIHETKTDIARSFRMCIVAYLVGSMLLLLLSSYSIPILFGSSFKTDANIVALLLTSSLLSMSSDGLAEYLNGNKNPSADTIGRVLHLVTTLILIYIFAPILGILGIALAMTCSDLIRLVWLVIKTSIFINLPVLIFFRLRKSDAIDVLQIFKKYLRLIFVRE